MTNNPFAPKPSRRDARRALRKMGLGDKVHSIAQPIAHAIDEVFGTNIQECGGCKRRRARLNGRLDSDTLVNDASTNVDVVALGPVILEPSAFN